MSVLRKVALIVAFAAAALFTAAPAVAVAHHPVARHAVARHAVVKHAVKLAAPVGQQCPGNVPGYAQPGFLDTGANDAFNPYVGGYYNNLSAGVVYCIPAGWEVLTMQALPGNPVYGVPINAQQWVNWTYTDANGNPVDPYSGVAYTATPHPVSSWVLLGYQS